PGEPEHREDDRELEEAHERDVLREVVRRLPDDRHVDEVVEQLEVADRAVLDDRAVWPRRAEQPALELALGSGLVRHRRPRQGGGFETHDPSCSASRSVMNRGLPWIATSRSSAVPVFVKPCGTFDGPTTTWPSETTARSSPSWKTASPASTMNTSG